LTPERRAPRVHDAVVDASPPLERFVKTRQVLLTTYRKDGTPVGTPVNIAVDGPVGYVRTWGATGKIKRIRNNPQVEIAPCTGRGKPTGEPLRMTARILEGEESERAGQAIEAKHPVLQGRIVPWYHRWKHLKTTHIELTPA
jgi:PPOX class probable F420-dependent enzyme